MARPAGGVEHVVAARELLRSAKTAEELRRAQAVLLPLDLGLSLEQTARAIGRSVNATCAIRTRFAKVAEGVMGPPQAKTALRNHALADLEREASILDEVLADAQKGGIVVIPQRMTASLPKPQSPRPRYGRCSALKESSTQLSPGWAWLETVVLPAVTSTSSSRRRAPIQYA